MKLNSRFLATVTGVLALAAGAAQAANITAAKTTYSKEGVSDATTVNLPTAVVTLNAAYAAGDIVKVTLSGSAIDSSSAPLFDGCTAGNAAFGSLGISGQVVTFRVTAAVADTTGTACNLHGLVGTGASIGASSSITLAYAATAGSTTTAIDTGCTGANCVANSVTLATVRSQFAAAATTKFGKTIDVSAPSLRTLFTVAGADTATLAVSTDHTVDVPLGTYDAVLFDAGTIAVPTGVAVTLHGDFSFTDRNANGTCTTAEVTAAVSVAGAGWSIASATCTQIKLTYTAATPDVAGTISINPALLTPPPARIALKAQSFTSDVTVTYTGGGATTGLTEAFTGVAAGSWGLNGASVFVPYMPYGTGISAILYVTNNSSLAGEVTIDWIDDAGHAGSFAAGSAAAASVTSISGLVATGLAAGGFSGTGKVALTVTVNAPATNVEVFSAYNVSGNRNVVVNTSNGVGGGH